MSAKSFYFSALLSQNYNTFRSNTTLKKPQRTSEELTSSSSGLRARKAIEGFALFALHPENSLDAP
jgi:hypothetical protein